MNAFFLFFLKTLFSFCIIADLAYLCPQNKNKNKNIMRKVIGIGENVLDIIFKTGKPIEAVPGGSSFNAVISLGCSGVNSS